MLISFMLFPFIVAHVGKEIYGVYLIVLTVTDYFGLLDFGMMSALTKYVSEYHGKKDFKGIGHIINASFTFYVIIGVLISLMLFLSSKYFIYFFKIDPANIRVMRDLLIAAALSSLVVWPMGIFRRAIQGLNMWNLDAAISIINQILLAIVTFFILIKGFGILQLFIAMQILNFTAGAVFFWFTVKHVNFRIVFPHRNINTFKFIFNFSIFMFLSSLSAIFLYQIHNIIIGYFVSVSAISLYAVAFNLQNYFRVINSTLGGPAWIAASEMEGAHDYARQKQLLFKGTKLMSAVLLPAVLIAIFFAKPFIIHWMGESFRESILPARIIMSLWLFSGTSELAVGLLSAKGIVRRTFFIILAAGISNLLVSLIFVKSLGIVALAAGLAFSMIFVAFPLELALSLKMLKVTFKEYFDKSVKVNLLLYLLVAIFSTVVLFYLYPSNFIATIFEMAVIYGVSLGFYYFKLLKPAEKEEVKKAIGFDMKFQRNVKWA